MPSSFLEIVQLASGEIVLQRADDDDAEPMVNIRFSGEALEHLDGAEMEVAKLMIQAGIQAVAHISETQQKTAADSEDELDEGEGRIIH